MNSIALFQFHENVSNFCNFLPVGVMAQLFNFIIMNILTASLLWNTGIFLELTRGFNISNPALFNSSDFYQQILRANSSHKLCMAARVSWDRIYMAELNTPPFTIFNSNGEVDS